MVSRIWITAIAIAASSGLVWGQAKTPKLPEGTISSLDLAYGPHERNKLDLHRPRGEGPFPLIIWVHGGAWSAGSKDGYNPALRLLERGYAVASINYRLSQHALYPAQIQDCKAAVRYLRRNAQKHALDPDHFGAWGASAGGHLVALLGTTDGVQELEGELKDEDKGISSAVQAVCDWYGPTDFLTMNKQSTIKGPIDHDSPTAPEAKLIGGAVQQNKEKSKQASPLTYVSAKSAPFLIVHGDKDSLVPVAQSEQLEKALKEAKVPVRLITLAGAGHGGKDFTSKETSQATDEFFDKYLKPKK